MNESQEHNQLHADDRCQALLFEAGPYGNLDAIVQHDHRVVYFYLNGPEPFGTRACWVRNLQTGPWMLNKDEMAEGIPPMLPRTHCTESAGQPIPNPQDLEIVWLEEGNGAALKETGKTIAMIPPWSGIDGFHGYAAACASESPLCWPMPENPQLATRIRRAEDFWRSCQQEANHPFAILQPQIMDVYHRRFGEEEKYFSLDGGQFPPRGAALFRTSDDSGDPSIVIATVGMSFRPQPNVELFVEEPRGLRRIELAISIHRDATETELQPLLETISGLAAYPWQNWTWYGPGHTCPLAGLGSLLGDEFEFFLFVSENQLKTTSAVPIPDFRNDPVNLLWMLPITAVEHRALEKREIELEQILTLQRLPRTSFQVRFK